MKFFIIIYIAFSFASNDKIQSELVSNQNWIFIKIQDKLTLSTKSIKGYTLSGVRVESPVNIPLYNIQDVILDINNYDSILVSSKGIKTIEIERSNNSLIAYQFIPIDIPFMSDRHYFFNIKKNNIIEKEFNILIQWSLIDHSNYSNNLEHNIENSIYLENGSGVWITYQNENGDTILSYRIFIDPGGWIPEIIIDKINEISIINIFKDVINEAHKRL